MKDPFDRAVRAIASRNSFALIWLQFGLAHLVVFGGFAMLTLYRPVPSGKFWLITGLSQAVVSLDNGLSIKLVKSMWRPVWAWERGPRTEATAIAAWNALATFPLDYFRRLVRHPLAPGYLPLMV